MASRLRPIAVTTPGVWGINLSQSGDTLNTEWCTRADNLVIGDLGDLHGRDGFNPIGIIGLSGVLLGTFEYIASNNDKFLIITSSTGIFIYDGINAVVDITNGVMLGEYTWVNFNGRLVGHLNGQAGIVTLANPLSTLSLHSQAEIGSDAVGLLSAFGRTWIIDNNIVKYCTNILDETAWEVNGLVLDLSWENGRDVGTALKEHDGNLIIFGEDSIIVYRGDASVGNMNKIEAIRGLGCIAPKTITQVGDETLFLSKSGLRSLNRTLRDGKMPTGDLANTIRRTLSTVVSGSTANVSGVFMPKHGYYLLSTPRVGAVLCFNTNITTPLDSYAITTWNVRLESMCLFNSDLIAIHNNNIVKYTGTHDNNESIPLTFTLPWWGMDTETQRGISLRAKFPKRALVTISGSPKVTNDIAVQLCYAFDWDDATRCVGVGLKQSTGGGVEWNEFEWGEADWGSSSGKSNYKFQLSNSGSVVQIGIKMDQLLETLTINELNVQVKTGRITYG